MLKDLYIKDLKIDFQSSSPVINGDFCQIDGQDYYRISNYDQMRPFFMSLVSHSDHWLFISSTGGLSAGRKNSESALFPYYTDDKLEDSSEVTGNKTIITVVREGRTLLWEPFSSKYEMAYAVQRNLYKNILGTVLIFEEINKDLGLTFQYSWSFSEQYGFIKTSKILNQSDSEIQFKVLDGIQNIMPYGVNSALQANASNLVNAYKKNEIHEETGLGMFMLSAIIVDRAEPSEALKTTTVWSRGLEASNILLSSNQIADFRKGLDLKGEADIRAERGAYFINASFSLDQQASKEWQIVAEVDQDHSDVFQLINELNDKERIGESLNFDLAQTNNVLKQLVGKADGLQISNDQLITSRHFANTLFNIMRGGIFDDGYKVNKHDLLNYVKVINKTLIEDELSFFKELPNEINYQELIAMVKDHTNPNIIRLCYEYLPLTFSRRHGDPSRPWNKFTISLKDEGGNKLRDYEGNWRDIFQNWEALSVSFPNYLLSMISKFLNASTIDGYNPYRITRNGIDWETIEPDDPWSYIGYWGDHQIIYLQKLLELAYEHNADDLRMMLNKAHFVYANVPYRIKDYKDVVDNPKDTIDFDNDLQLQIEAKVETLGSDGKLVYIGDTILNATLAEKLLLPFLSKMTNYIPEGGIWLNTQRPEWNDANNALVGYGVSMVTLYYMRRYALFMLDLFKIDQTLDFNVAVKELLISVNKILTENTHLLESSINSKAKRLVVDELGKVGESFRNKAYVGLDGQIDNLSSNMIREFFKATLQHIDHTIKANKRPDQLFHAYNLVSFDHNEIKIDHLYEMLEGQVAILSSGFLNFEEVLSVLDALKASNIYRNDQYSYMLYPNRELPKFLEKNTIPDEYTKTSKLVAILNKDKDYSVLKADVNGKYHFNGSFNNVDSLKLALNNLSEKYPDEIKEEYYDLLMVFENMFNHKEFTGRSGTFYGYEGLGSIYWHMVSKLLLAVQENINSGWDQYNGTEAMGKMIDHYYEIRAGIGINKSPELYGSFPTDPYSHTPGNKGVQQPGMTGQVKEDFLNRFAELGVFVKDSKIHFQPKFLNDSEYLKKTTSFKYYDVNENLKSIEIEKDHLAFTYCQVPIIYKKATKRELQIFDNSSSDTIEGGVLSEEDSRRIFNRSGEIFKIVVSII